MEISNGIIYSKSGFREFCSLMVKREREKETVEDLKQAFRVFDKVNANNLIKECMQILWFTGWKRLRFYFWVEICHEQVESTLFWTGFIRNLFWIGQIKIIQNFKGVTGNDYWGRYWRRWTGISFDPETVLILVLICQVNFTEFYSMMTTD